VDVVVLEVAHLYRLRGERVVLDLVAGVREVVDERGFPHVGVAGDDDGRLVGPDIRQRLELVADLPDLNQVVLDFVHDVGHPVLSALLEPPRLRRGS
jgi:hypothetical protein